MKTIFIPGIVLLNTLRYPIKFGIIFAIILVPLLILSTQLVSSLSQEVEFLNNERLGLAYIKTMRLPIEQIQQHRGMMATYLNGAKEFESRIIAKRKQVDAAMAEAARIDKQMAKAMKTSGLFSSLEQQWESIKANSFDLSPKVVIEKHNDLVTGLLELMNKVASSSGITFDSSLDSHYMGTALVASLPKLTENMGQARAIASSVAAAGLFTPTSFTSLAILSNNIDTIFKELEAGLYAAFAASSQLEDQLHDAVEGNHKAIVTIQKLLNDDLLNASTVSVDGETVFNQATLAISRSFALYDRLVPALDQLFVKRLDHARSTLVLTIAVVVLVLLIIAYLFVALYLSVRNSVDQISTASKHLAGGDLTARVDLPVKDEMREVAEHYNNMASNFASLIHQVVNVSNQLANASENVSSVSTDSGNIVTRQREETTLVATAIEEMTATVREVANNASGAASAAGNADKEAQEGRDVVESTTQGIGSLAQEIENAANVIKNVEQDSESIGSVLDVIKSVAEQTNLLALNAAIEAARAGEQGRGFAVVADEVRTLASRTHKSTQEIEEMIVKLQTGARGAVSVMDASRQLAQSSESQAQKAAGSLEGITGAIATINDLNMQIASAAEQQSAVSEEINRNINSISELSDQAATGSLQTSASAGELAQLATQLQTLVAKFKFK